MASKYVTEKTATSLDYIADTMLLCVQYTNRLQMFFKYIACFGM